jgi:DNA-binding transcriptional regulator YiaG
MIGTKERSRGAKIGVKVGERKVKGVPASEVKGFKVYGTTAGGDVFSIKVKRPSGGAKIGVKVGESKVKRVPVSNGKGLKASARTSRVGVLSKAPKGSKVKVIQVRRKMGLSQSELARVTGYSLRSIAGWEVGRPLSEPARQKLVETERLRVALSAILPPGHLGEWLRLPNPAFEGQIPIQVIERGEVDRLWHMIHQIDAGVAS